MSAERALAMVRMGRPLVLVAGLLAFFAGACMAWWRVVELPMGTLLASLLIMVSAILMGHYANEYADFDTDSITRRTLFSGGSGVLPSGVVPKKWALYAAIGLLLITVIGTASAYLTGLIGLQVVALAAIGLPLGWWYSMPPLRLERTWAGEPDNALLGYMMLLMGYVPFAGMDILALAIGPPVFLIILVNLLGVHHADREADAMVGKRTLAVALGDRTPRVFALLVVLTYLTIIPLAMIAPGEVVLALVLTIPAGAWAVAGFMRTGGPEYGSLLMGLWFLAIGAGFLLAV
ncbi:MAG: prenyltransferase [Methanomassiliicoccales archaeon]|nr:prenyltransferase [Methanomassiliicoccales archaeon]